MGGGSRNGHGDSHSGGSSGSSSTRFTPSAARRPASVSVALPPSPARRGWRRRRRRPDGAAPTGEDRARLTLLTGIGGGSDRVLQRADPARQARGLPRRSGGRCSWWSRRRPGCRCRWRPGTRKSSLRVPVLRGLVRRARPAARAVRRDPPLLAGQLVQAARLRRSRQGFRPGPVHPGPRWQRRHLLRRGQASLVTRWGRAHPTVLAVRARRDRPAGLAVRSLKRPGPPAIRADPRLGYRRGAPPAWPGRPGRGWRCAGRAIAARLGWRASREGRCRPGR
jgi:hypothetical protein